MMPPSRRSSSSRSAHKDSDQIPSDQNYTLGEYTFRVERSAGTSPNYDKIEAICTKDGKNARKSIQVPSTTKMLGWYVEANETEASVYVNLQAQGGPDVPSELINSGSSGGGVDRGGYPYSLTFSGSGLMTHYVVPGTTIGIFASESPGVVLYQTYSSGSVTQYPLSSAITYNGKTAYYTTTSGNVRSAFPSSSSSLAQYSGGDIAWTMIYGESSGETETKLVGRFAIDAEDAGGTGPDSDWEDPEDGGDPTYTLYVEVAGALSGRHNDPIVDPSYSYIPSDKATVKQYGCGGDGGHGGGGGAGAATVVVHKFATNQAGNKEITALARRHGYGSGGGKGGKGGDGCVLIFY